MPRYEFMCETCKQPFELLLTISEREKGDLKCPTCKARRWCRSSAASWHSPGDRDVRFGPISDYAGLAGWGRGWRSPR
jgi:putative FmdB family regulatory protein